MAQQLLQGKLIYVDVWDTKPLGIFLLFAAVLGVFGQSIFAIRLAGAVVVALTGWLLYRSKLLLGANKQVALFGGVLYVVLMSAYRFGMAINTEVFFNAFVVMGLYFLLRKESVVSFFLAGLAWGLGFIVKYVVLFDAFAIVLVLIGVKWLIRKEMKPMRGVVLLMIMAIGFALPFLLCNGFYYLIGHYPAFYEATFEVPGRYTSTVIWTDAMAFIVKFHLKFLPAMLLFYYAVVRKWPAIRKGDVEVLLPLVWFMVVWVPVILPGKYFDHYFGQLLLSVSLMASAVAGLEKERWYAWLKRNTAAFILTLSVLVLGLVVGNQSYFFTSQDTSAKIATRIENKLQAGETVYAGKKLQAVYFLLNVPPPTKYVHPTLLTFASHVRTLGVDPDQEFRQILEKEPRFVFFKAPHPNAFFMEQVQARYEPIEQYKKGVVLYERKKL
jgi:hypothetical protein